MFSILRTRGVTGAGRCEAAGVAPGQRQSAGATVAGGRLQPTLALAAWVSTLHGASEHGQDLR